VFSRKRTCGPFDELSERSSVIEGGFLRREDLSRIDVEGSIDWGSTALDDIPSLYLEGKY
jgi:hypothetical protein